MGRLGDTIKLAREEKGLSVKQAAKKAGLSEKYLRDVEMGIKVPSEDIAGRVLKMLGAYEDTTTAFYDGGFDREPEASPPPPPPPVQKPKPKPQPVDEGPSDAWISALSGIMKKIPIYDAQGSEVGSRLMAVEAGRVEGMQPDKLSYFRIEDDSMRGYRMRKGDILLVSAQSSAVADTLLLVQARGERMVRRVTILRDGRVRLHSLDGAAAHADYDAKDVQILGKCIRLEITL